MSLYDILACPICKVAVDRDGDRLTCRLCAQDYPIVNGVPVMLPRGKASSIQNEEELSVRKGYDPWIHRTALQSLLDNQVVIELGAGSMAVDDPCIIRTDISLTPYVDVVADAHALPFLPGTIDYVFSLAVFEHLRNPFLAAAQIYDVLKDGGWIYHECNFVFPYHGYPHHYFNASQQGLEQVFHQFHALRTGVAPYQMPSFTLDSLLRVYLQRTQARRHPHGRMLVRLIEQVIALNGTDYDIYFSEEDALAVAAGTYFAGVKRVKGPGANIPAIIVDQYKDVCEAIDDIFRVENALLQAKQRGRDEVTAIREWIDSVEPFLKKGSGHGGGRPAVAGLDVVDARFGAIGFAADQAGLDELSRSCLGGARKRRLKSMIRSWLGRLLRA